MGRFELHSPIWFDAIAFFLGGLFIAEIFKSFCSIDKPDQQNYFRAGCFTPSGENYESKFGRVFST